MGQLVRENRLKLVSSSLRVTAMLASIVPKWMRTLPLVAERDVEAEDILADPDIGTPTYC